MKQKAIILIISLFITLRVLPATSDSTNAKRVKFTGVPTVGFNQSYGAQIGVMTMLLFHINKEDTISPPSSLNLIGFFSSNRSWFGIVFQRLYFNKDNWRLMWGLGTGDNKFQFYTEEIPGSGGVYIDYTTTTLFGFASASRRIYDKIYAGIMVGGNKLNTKFYLENIINENPDSLKKLLGWGILLAYDTRDNQFNPSKGINANLRTNFNQHWMGSDLNFSSISIDMNYYKKITSRGILASRIKVYTGLGEIPFEGQRVIGRGDIRGYTSGKYRGDQIYTVQTEYRHTFPNRLGFVVFFGLAGSVNNLAEENNWSGILPGAGAGFRYMALEDYKINIGFDLAVGKGDKGIYFRLGEAF